jgi:pyridoxamine--pyruvate transaminase
MAGGEAILFSLFPSRVYHRAKRSLSQKREQFRESVMTSNRVREPVITLSAGPVAAFPRVLRAMSRPVHYDFDPYFQEFYEEVTRKAAKAMRVKDPALILHCEPAPGIEAAAASLISPDDVVLNLASGVYGKGFGYWSARYHKEMVEIEVPYNEAIEPRQVAEAFRKRPDIKVVSLVHHDTPSGTINPAREIGKIVRDHDALLIVDAVSSFGGMDIHPEDCRADIFITGPGKCLGGAPGVTLMAVSDRAWKHMEANPKAPRASVLSLLDWKDAWSRDKPFPFTPSVSEVNGLDAVFDQYLEEGPEQVWRRHALTSKACRAGVKAMGLALWAKTESIASPTTTAVRIPDGFKDSDIIRAAREQFGVVFSTGRGETLGKLLRIGHMGPVAEPVYAVVALTALGGALRQLGRKTDVAAGVEAAMAVIQSA